MELSVIIPVAAQENSWQELLNDLSKLPEGSELLFVSVDSIAASLRNIQIPGLEVRRITAAPGRASHMNAGAQEAHGEYLWFLHADSRFARNTVTALRNTVHNHPKALIFFDLAFLSDATPLVKLNQWGARFRSRILKVPFGDQGFCIRKDLFEELGGYPVDVLYGEDHIFVWRARRYGIALKPAGARLYTSARKYRENGWLKTTALYQYLWIKQAWQEWRKWKKYGITHAK